MLSIARHLGSLTSIFSFFILIWLKTLYPPAIWSYRLFKDARRRETAITWVGSHLPADTPTIVILHTITGSPSSMRELVRDLHRFTGWRIALCVRRGHADLNFSIPQFNLFGSTADLKNNLILFVLSSPIRFVCCWIIGWIGSTGALLGWSCRSVMF